MPASDVSRETPAVPLSPAQRGQIEAVLAQLERDERAPTTVRERHLAADRHVADSLAALDLDVLAGVGRIVDIGSGAGFPGLPIAIALPRAEVWLLESQRRRCEFLERTRLAANVTNARVVCARAEEWSEGRGAQDVALARALGLQAVVLEYAAPLLRLGGALVEWRGRRDERLERAGARAAAELGLELREVRRVYPFAGASDHHLHVFVKVRQTPPRFPRRAGVARKRPLGG